jgi:hypothetical protein
MKQIAILGAAAFMAVVLGFAGPASADHKGFNHGKGGSKPDPSSGIISGAVALECSFDTGTLTIESWYFDTSGEGSFYGKIDVLVEAFEKPDGGSVNFTSSGSVSHNGVSPYFYAKDTFGGLSFGLEDDLTGVVTVTGVDGSLYGVTLYETCDSEQIVVF